MKLFHIFHDENRSSKNENSFGTTTWELLQNVFQYIKSILWNTFVQYIKDNFSKLEIENCSIF